MGAITMVMRDYDGDKKQFSVGVGDTLDDTTFDADETATYALRDAILDLSIGHLAKFAWVAQLTTPADTDATEFAAQAHYSWLITARDNTDSSVFTFNIPCPDITDDTLVLSHTTFADMTDARWIAFKTAFEAIGRSPNNHGVTLVSAELRE